MREAIRSIVDAIAPLDPEELGHRAAVIDWIDSGAGLFRTRKPATPPMHLVSYCVLVDPDADSLLLVEHRDARRWLPTGGHVDPGEHPSDAARREIREELGISPVFHQATGGDPLMVTVTQTAGVSESHTDVSLWYAFAGSEEQQLHPDPGEFVATRWWRVEDVVHGPETRFDPHLPRFVDKLRQAAP